MDNGGKATSLAKLREGGYPVPPFFVCDSSWTKKEILRKIDEELAGVQYFAVRSSATNEDSQDKSFAGHFYSAVGVSKKNVLEEVCNVQGSFKGMSGSVIIQEFIPSDMAGVMFTEVGKNHIVINATSGLCLPVVAGEACDEYILDRKGNLLDKTIPEKKKVKFFRRNKIISEEIKIESLDETKIMELTNLGLKIQNYFGIEQDVEWCFLNDKIYILQSRPITQDFNIRSKEYFDSANIAESYSGIVLPLTCSFARLIYGRAYRDLLRMSGVSAQKIEQHSEVFNNLLGFFYGRMYYNMNNWYHMTAFVPGYKRNKANFELMITSNVKQNITTSIFPSIGLKIAYPIIVFVKVCLFGFVSFYFSHIVKRKIRELGKRDFKQLYYKDCIVLFNNLHNKLLRRWYITLENDFFVMTYLGLLKKIITEESLQEFIVFPSKATQQVAELTKLSKQAKTIKPLWKAIESDDLKTFNDELEKAPELQKLIEIYLTDFGGRFASELKLESTGVDEDPSKLLSVLKVYSTYKLQLPSSAKKIELPFFKRILFNLILSKFKKYASRREEFRLLRSNTFAVARRIFRRMGELLVREGVLQKMDDAFYLQMEEILDPFAMQNKNLNQLVRKRKHNYDFYKSIKPPAHFVTTENALPEIESMVKLDSSTVQGRPASPGIVRGKVKIFKEFTMPKKIDFDILVTTHTDPGWTSLIALSKGLVIEHGGVLSHASIVARELKIPAVIGARNAVDFLKDDQVVEINGSTGAIKII